MKTFIEEKFSHEYKENIERLSLICQENADELRRIVKNENSNQLLERKLFSLGRVLGL
jgi:hypothetical protein